MQVVDDDKQPVVLGHRDEQPERRGRDCEAIGNLGCLEREDGAQRACLRVRQALDAVGHGPDQITEPRECQTGFRRGASGAQESPIGRARDRVIEQRRLPDARLPLDQADGAATQLASLQHAVNERRLLAGSDAHRAAHSSRSDGQHTLGVFMDIGARSAVRDSPGAWPRGKPRMSAMYLL